MLKIYLKASKNLKFTSICSDDHGGFVTPSDQCAVALKNLNLKHLSTLNIRMFEKSSIYTIGFQNKSQILKLGFWRFFEPIHETLRRSIRKDYIFV